MAFRVLAGFLAFWLCLGFLAGLRSGKLSLLLMASGGILLVAAFLVYAIGGNNLIKRILPFLGEE
jgi:hypothetical protein